MPRSLPLITDLLPPLDGRPFSRHEWNELRAVRLALVMVTAVLHQSDFLHHNRPVPGGHDADLHWLHEHLDPLARVSPTVRKLNKVFDLSLYGREFYDPARVRRNLKMLAKDAVLLGSIMATRSTGSPRRLGRGQAPMPSE